MSRYTAVPAPFRFRFTTGHVDLCGACAAVLLVEGSLVSPATDPEPLTMVGWTRTDPAPPSALCDGCEAAADCAAHAPVLKAPPARLAGCPGNGEDYCDSQQGTYCAHHADAYARWAAETPF